MRNIKRIVLHCTATPQNTTVQSILNYWKNVKGWKNPGYHYLVEANGKVHNLLPVNEIANGARGYNYNSIHISYIGGIDNEKNPMDNRTDAQKQATLALIATLRLNYINVPILGHRDLPNVTKACPSFDVKNWIKPYYG